MSCSRGTEEDFFLAGRSLVWWQVSAPRGAPGAACGFVCCFHAGAFYPHNVELRNQERHLSSRSLSSQVVSYISVPLAQFSPTAVTRCLGGAEPGAGLWGPDQVEGALLSEVRSADWGLDVTPVFILRITALINCGMVLLKGIAIKEEFYHSSFLSFILLLGQ